MQDPIRGGLANRSQDLSVPCVWLVGVTRFRMIPTAAQEAALLGHCAHARFMWNLALEQWAMWSPTRRGYPPGYVGQARQLTDARAETAWLRLGSQTVQQPALRDFARAQRGSRRRSKIKSAIARMRAKEADRRRNWGEQTTTDLARRFDTIRIEDLRITQMTRTARGTAEKPGRNVRAKAGLNRAIRRQGWGLLARRLDHKAASRLERVRAAYTSLTCSRCGTVDREARENQATFRCRSCGFAANADVNAAINIAAGRAVTARGAGAGLPAAKREPQFATST